MQWTHLFSKSILDRGNQYYRTNRVSRYQRQGDMHTVSVKGTKPYRVTIQLRNGTVTKMGCSCPYARDGYRCKHMAAALYYMEAARILESEEPVSLAQLVTNPESSNATENTYHYFNHKEITETITMPQSQIQMVKELIDQDKITLNRVDIGYYGLGRYESDADTPKGVAHGSVTHLKFNHDVTVYFDKDQVTYATCSVPGCGRTYYANVTYGPQNPCIHQAALTLLTAKYLETHNPGDDTSKSAASFLDHYRKQGQKMRPNHASSEAKSLNLTLKPRLQVFRNEWKVSFKIAANKAFVVKDLSEFVSQVENHQTVLFGSSTEWELGIENFSEQGKRYYHFIRQIVLEEEERKRALFPHSGYYRENEFKIKDSIPLFGRRLDDFFDAARNDAFEFHDLYKKEKKAPLVTCRDQKPDVQLTIKKQTDQHHQFQGIQITGTAPELLSTPNGAYFFDSGSINRVPADVLNEIKPLIDSCDSGNISLKIGRKHLGEFYHQILPRLQKHCKIAEIHRHEILSYIPPEVSFHFYLDAEDTDLVCRCEAIYGDYRHSLVQTLQSAQNNLFEVPQIQQYEDYRDLDSERYVLKQVQKLFPYLDAETNCFRCNGEEELMYHILSGGVSTLMTLGEVQATDRFKSRNIRRRSNLSVGVSVKSQIMDLSISSEDLSLQEVLEVLDSYRRKQRYHRLKNGDFFDLESDTETLEFLQQLMDTMQIPLKEFVKGKMTIPAYRALYLDKMLENCDGAHVKRDRRFKSLVRDFKTIDDADFEVPETLQKTLRKYQETGYRWLRTLETYGFGGILADDMGLGKTLQVITLLLAGQESKQKTGPALIITPASLVYNWGEEFRRFAPQLQVCLVTGNQKERLEKLKNSPDTQVYITSYDLLKRDIAKYDDLHFTYEILDEAQYIKNHTTSAAKAVKIIHSQHRFALTGTPIENRLSELWSIFDYLMPGYLYSYDKFRKTFENPIVKHQDESCSERLKRMAAPFIMRRLKEQVLRDLPDKLEEIRYVKAESEQQKLLDGQVAHMKTLLEQTDDADFNKNRLKILAELIRIRQICCDPSLCFENYNGGSAKREACTELIQNAVAGNHKILVFSQFTSMLELLEEDMKRIGISYYKITGNTPKEERIRLVNAFNQDQTPVFFISLKAGGTGLNLVGADMVIHYDPWWNLAVQNQATDRAHRIGQTKVVTVYKMIVKDSIEEKILLMQETKKNLADEILSGENGQISSMSKEELLHLLDMGENES